jgi:glycerol-3-phosphate dehydrogenase
VIARFPFLEPAWAARLVRGYGTTAATIFGEAKTLADCGEYFGHGFTECEALHLVTREWARTADDMLWRRTKLGLRFTATEREALERWLTANAG